MSQPSDIRDRGFLLFLALFAGLYVALIVGMIFADATYTTPGDLLAALESKEIRYAAKLSFTSSTITALLSVWFAIPIGYLLSRTSFPGKALAYKAYRGRHWSPVVYVVADINTGGTGTPLTRYYVAGKWRFRDQLLAVPGTDPTTEAIVRERRHI